MEQQELLQRNAVHDPAGSWEGRGRGGHWGRARLQSHADALSPEPCWADAAVVDRR